MPLQCVRFVKMSTEVFFLSNYTGYRSSEAWETSENIKRKKGVFSSVGVTTMVLPSLKNLTYTTRDSIKQLTRDLVRNLSGLYDQILNLVSYKRMCNQKHFCNLLIQNYVSYEKISH